MMFSDFPNLLSLSSSSSSLSFVDKTPKRLLQFILNVSVLFPCFRGAFGTVFNVSSNTVFRLQSDLFRYIWFFISNCIMVFFNKFPCNKLSFCRRRMPLTSFNRLTSKKMLLGDYSRVEFFNDCFSIKTWSTIKDCIATTSVFNKFFLFSRETLLLKLDSLRFFGSLDIWRFTSKWRCYRCSSRRTVFHDFKWKQILLRFSSNPVRRFPRWIFSN